MNQNAVCAPAAGSRNTQKKRFTLKMRTREALTGYLFISVNLIGTLIFVVLPPFPNWKVCDIRYRYADFRLSCILCRNDTFLQ